MKLLKSKIFKGLEKGKLFPSKTILLIITLIILTTTVSAFEIEINTLKGEILQEETAEFLAIIKSNASHIQNIEVYTPDIEWNLPIQTIKAYPEKDTAQKLLLTPTRYVGPGMYGVKINFKDKTTEEIQEKILYVNVKLPGKAVSSYVPSIVMEVKLEKEIDPNKILIIGVNIENQNLLNLTDLTLKITSDLEELNIEEKFVLGPLEKKLAELNYELNALTAPGEYTATFEILKNKETIEIIESKKITIKKINPDFNKEETTTKSFLKTTTTTTYTSKSNIEETQQVKIPTTITKKLFTYTEPESETTKEEGKRYLTIEMTLQPGEEKTITTTTSYRAPAIIALILLIFIAMYYFYKSPVTIRKGVTDIKMQEGGISELKVLLEIKNNNDKPVKNVAIIDYIPNIAELATEFMPGTITPTKVLAHKAKGSILKWTIEEMAPGEDRLISYNIKSKLSIIGNFKLPRAKVIFKQKNKEIRSYSNSLGVKA